MGGQAALTVTAKGFEGAADGRVTLIGDVERVGKEQVEHARGAAAAVREGSGLDGARPSV